MRIKIYNLHNMCENNTFFLSRAWRYFLLNGHTVVDGRGEVDLVFVGGCAVTDEMCHRCEAIILQGMKLLKHSRFVVFGCLAAFQESLEPIAVRYADRLHIIPYRASHKLDQLIQAHIPFETVRVSRLKGHIPYQPCIGPEDYYVLVAQGCVNHCSYCNIKKVKGNVISRSLEIIESEVRDLYDNGIRMVTLLADDCGSYGLDQASDLPQLLTRLDRVAPDLRYKLYSVFPLLFLKYMPRLEPFFTQHRVSYVCLPVQSANKRVLSLMSRNYDPDHLAEAIMRIRDLDSQVFIYSHFIFNFPTETWDEFEQSIAFARHFDHSVFIGYGENSGTPAADLFPKCDNEALQAKVQRLGELVNGNELKAFVVPKP